MFDKLLNIVVVLLSLICMNVGYADNMKSLQSVLNPNVSVEEKIEYLEKVKNQPASSFVVENISSIKDIISFYVRYKYSVSNNADGDKEYIDKYRNIFSDDKLIGLVLEVLLRNDIYDFFSNYQTAIKVIANLIHLGFEDNFFIRDFLPLKVLIKIDILADDLEYNEVFRGTDPSYPTWANVKKEVEEFIFRPMLLREEKYKESLYDYEKYLLDRIEFLNTNDNLKELFKESFDKSEYGELKPLYIDRMFYFDMTDILLNIISDRSVNGDLRKQAVRTSLKLLPFTKSYEEFSDKFLNVIEEISKDSKEDKNLKSMLDYLLQIIKSEGVSLKEGSYLCKSLFM